MSTLPPQIETGERARLFPVLSETSKEGRTTSVFLSCLANVKEYGSALLASLGQRVGARAQIEVYTEVGFGKKAGEKTLRPDGLIVLKVGSRRWSALIEAKVGNNELSADQIENYIALAQANGIDAVVTISNAFTATPSHHPLPIKTKAKSKVQLYHWSWMYLLTEADLLISNNDVEDGDQSYILSELARFLTHPSAGVKGFDAMPKSWGDLAQMIRNGGAVTANSSDAQEVVGAWHQEVRDLSLILSRQVGVEVVNKLPRALVANAAARVKADLATLCETQSLYAMLVVPDAAAPVDVCVDMRGRSVTVSARLQAPADKKTTKARLNWLLKQLQKSEDNDLQLRLHWPGRGPHTQHSLAELRDDVSLAEAGKEGAQVSAIEICAVRALGARFAQSKNFIKDLEQIVPDFYLQVLQHLRSWQPPAPKMREGRTDASGVTPSALAEDLEEDRPTDNERGE